MRPLLVHRPNDRNSREFQSTALAVTGEPHSKILTLEKAHTGGSSKPRFPWHGPTLQSPATQSLLPGFDHLYPRLPHGKDAGSLCVLHDGCDDLGSGSLETLCSR